jgi:hypothetical protein
MTALTAMDKLLFWLGLGAAQKGARSNNVGADVARPPIDFRFRWKSGRAADINSKTGFHPICDIIAQFLL